MSKNEKYVIHPDMSVSNLKDTDNKYIGHISIQFSSSKNKKHIIAHFWSLMIYEEFQKKGYAQKLRSRAIEICKTKGVKKIKTYVSSRNKEFKNIDLVNFYKKNFIENGAKKVVVRDDSCIIAKF